MPAGSGTPIGLLLLLTRVIASTCLALPFRATVEGDYGARDSASVDGDYTASVGGKVE